LQRSVFTQTAAHFSRFGSFLRAHLFTRENAWVILVSIMLLLILLLGTMSTQPRFVYGGF
jgi:hypothetical protein